MTTRRQFMRTSVAAVSAATLFAGQDEKREIIDAWGHVSWPRFMSAESLGSSRNFFHLCIDKTDRL